VKRKPSGARFRNLVVRGGAIYYERVVGGERIRFSCLTDDWTAAAAVRDEYEARKGIGTASFLRVQVPLLADFAKRYLAEDASHLAPTTLADRTRYLAEDGALLLELGRTKLDELTPSRVREWWNAQAFGTGAAPPALPGHRVRKKPRTIATGRTYLDALSAVLGYAVELGFLAENPVDAMRRSLHRRARTQRGRAEGESSRDVAPIEDPEHIRKLLDAARAEGLEGYAYVLLGLDAGLRRGEALGLRWGHVELGAGDEDARRALLVEESRSRGGEPGPTKSGRSRRVALSFRLRAVLEALYARREKPAAREHVLSSSFHRRAWERIVEGAGIGHRRFKDLRDTFASTLVSAGVPLAYVSRQLGHADVAVTARHYATWAGGDEYRDPPRLQPGELPADLIARLGEKPSPLTVPSSASARGASYQGARDKNAREVADFTGEELERETGFEPATSTLATWCSTN